MFSDLAQEGLGNPPLPVQGQVTDHVQILIFLSSANVQ